MASPYALWWDLTRGTTDHEQAWLARGFLACARLYESERDSGHSEADARRTVAGLVDSLEAKFE